MVEKIPNNEHAGKYANIMELKFIFINKHVLLLDRWEYYLWNETVLLSWKFWCGKLQIFYPYCQIFHVINKKITLTCSSIMVLGTWKYIVLSMDKLLYNPVALHAVK